MISLIPYVLKVRLRSVDSDPAQHTFSSTYHFIGATREMLTFFIQLHYSVEQNSRGGIIFFLQVMTLPKKREKGSPSMRYGTQRLLNLLSYHGINIFVFITKNHLIKFCFFTF